jgi:hypothetical protein
LATKLSSGFVLQIHSIVRHRAKVKERAIKVFRFNSVQCKCLQVLFLDWLAAIGFLAGFTLPSPSASHYAKANENRLRGQF